MYLILGFCFMFSFNVILPKCSKSYGNKRSTSIRAMILFYSLSLTLGKKIIRAFCEAPVLKSLNLV